MSIVRGITLVALIIAAGCATDSGPSNKPAAGSLARYGINTPPGFRPIHSDVPDVPWQQTFFRIARDVRLLPKLHREIDAIDMTMMANQHNDRLLFCAAVKFSNMTRTERREFLRRKIYALYDKNPKADFQRIQNRKYWDVIHSEGVRGDSDSAAQVVIYAVNRNSSVTHLLGAVWLSTGVDPFGMDRNLQSMVADLTGQ